MPVVVVTDSSSRLQPDELKQFDIRQVPLHVLLDGADLRDGVDDVPYDIHDRPRVTTAGATPAELAETYQQALSDSDGDGVVAVHLSAALSSTYSSAVQTAREFGSAVRVVNSRSAAMGVGFVALAAARAAAARVPISMPLRPRLVRRSPRGHVFVVVHRLDNLRRSGRIRKGASWLGTALSLKPLLCLDVDGRLVLDQRIRTVTKAHAAMVDRVAEVVGERRRCDRGTPCRQPRRRRRDRRGIDDAAAADRVARRHRHGAGARRFTSAAGRSASRCSWQSRADRR